MFVRKFAEFAHRLSLQEQVCSTVLVQPKHVRPRFADGLLLNQRLRELFAPLAGDIHGVCPFSPQRRAMSEK